MANNSEFANDVLKTLKTLFNQPEYPLISIGDEPDNLYFLVTGKCEVSNYDEFNEFIAIRYINPGDYFGEIAILH